jgi:hypothetical protein
MAKKGADHRRKALAPEQQGHIDGLCALYAVLNACKKLFQQAEATDEKLFPRLCDGVKDLFPQIMYKGTETEGVRRLIAAAQTWCREFHKRELVLAPLPHDGQFATIGDYFAFLRRELACDEPLRRVAVVGLGKPWNHFTVIEKVDDTHAHFFDSWGFWKKRRFDFFTLDEAKASSNANKTTYLDARQTFLLSVNRKARIDC